MANKNPTPPPNNEGKTYKTLKTFNPKAEMFKQFFLSPTSTTFMNVRGSAIRAGYSEMYADNITVQSPKWWNELKEGAEYMRASMLQSAEKNIKRTLVDTPENETALKLQHDASKFVSERLGKDFYSTRQELTDKGGRRLIPNETRSGAQLSLSTLFKGVQAPQ